MKHLKLFGALVFIVVFFTTIEARGTTELLQDDDFDINDAINHYGKSTFIYICFSIYLFFWTFHAQKMKWAIEERKNIFLHWKNSITFLWLNCIEFLIGDILLYCWFQLNFFSQNLFNLKLQKLRNTFDHTQT
jgi:hypothetical protein